MNYVIPSPLSVALFCTTIDYILERFPQPRVMDFVVYEGRDKAINAFDWFLEKSFILLVCSLG